MQSFGFIAALGFTGIPLFSARMGTLSCGMSLMRLLAAWWGSRRPLGSASALSGPHHRPPTPRETDNFDNHNRHFRNEWSFQTQPSTRYHCMLHHLPSAL